MGPVRMQWGGFGALLAVLQFALVALPQSVPAWACEFDNFEVRWP
jgi:hypothetical protein